jgi:hypothetical protein
MPATNTLLDQAHNAIARKLFAMKGFHHPQGSQQAFLTGLAHLYNLVPYQRRAKHGGHCVDPQRAQGIDPPSDHPEAMGAGNRGARVATPAASPIMTKTQEALAMCGRPAWRSQGL